MMTAGLVSNIHLEWKYCPLFEGWIIKMTEEAG